MPVLLHHLGKALQENKVLGKKCSPVLSENGCKTSLFACMLCWLQRKMLFALQLLGFAKHRLKLPGSPSNAGKWVRFLSLLVQPPNSPKYWKPCSHFQALSSCRTYTELWGPWAHWFESWTSVPAGSKLRSSIHVASELDMNYSLWTLLRHFFVSGLSCPCTHALCWKRATTWSNPACFLREKTSAFPRKAASVIPPWHFRTVPTGPVFWHPSWQATPGPLIAGPRKPPCYYPRPPSSGCWWSQPQERTYTMARGDQVALLSWPISNAWMSRAVCHQEAI